MAQDNEMRDLLVRLDESVKVGFKHINDKLDEITRRADGHETRIRSLEDWRTEIKGGWSGMGLLGKIGKPLLMVVLGAIGALGLQVALVPKDLPHKPSTEAVAGK